MLRSVSISWKKPATPPVTSDHPPLFVASKSPSDQGSFCASGDKLGFCAALKFPASHAFKGHVDVILKKGWLKVTLGTLLSENTITQKTPFFAWILPTLFLRISQHFWRQTCPVQREQGIHSHFHLWDLTEVNQDSPSQCYQAFFSKLENIPLDIPRYPLDDLCLFRNRG